MNTGSRRTLNRRLEHLKLCGCDFNNMHEYFGFKDTNNNIRKISLTRDPVLANVFKLTITQKKCALNPLQTYISQLPRDMNNSIYSYIAANRKLTYILEVPSDFPFSPLIWSLESFKENGCLKSHSEADPNEMYCGSDFSPAMSLETQILMQLSRISWLHDA
jgi:hypothetical protein